MFQASQVLSSSHIKCERIEYHMILQLPLVGIEHNIPVSHMTSRIFDVSGSLGVTSRAGKYEYGLKLSSSSFKRLHVFWVENLEIWNYCVCKETWGNLNPMKSSVFPGSNFQPETSEVCILNFNVSGRPPGNCQEGGRCSGRIKANPTGLGTEPFPWMLVMQIGLNWAIEVCSHLRAYWYWHLWVDPLCTCQLMSSGHEASQIPLL